MGQMCQAGGPLAHKPDPRCPKAVWAGSGLAGRGIIATPMNSRCARTVVRAVWCLTVGNSVTLRLQLFGRRPT